jgi:hypothetical protein
VANVKVFAYDGVEIRKCTLKDISLDGAYIKTKNFALPNGTNLEIVLKIRRGGKPRHCRLPAKVVRADRNGVAVIFGDLDDKLSNILLDIVKPSE